MGKDMLTRYIKFEWDDSATAPQNLSADLIPDSLNGAGFSAGEIDMTGSSDTVENFLADRITQDITAQFHMNDTATTGAFTVLNGTLQSVGTLTIAYGTGAVSTTGDPELEGEYVLLNATITPSGGKNIINARWRPGSAVAPTWGTV